MCENKQNVANKPTENVVKKPAKNSVVNPVFSMMWIPLLILLPMLGCMLGRELEIIDNEVAVRPVMELVLIGLLAYGAMLLYQRKQSVDQLLALVIVAGIVIRIGYMVYTGWYERYYDVGNLDTQNGHGAYIVHNLLKGHLPESNDYQFYHPPLYHMLSAVVLKVAGMFEGTTDYAGLIQYASVVSCAASCITLIFVQKILDALKIQRNYQVPALAILSFFPNWILMGGRVNNDGLLTMFMAMAVYFTIRWYYDTEMKWVIGIGCAFGFGMMSKISCGTLALITGPIMLYKLYKAWKEKQVWKVFSQLLVFAVICLPLSLWYPIRNYMEFGQGLNYVHDLGVTSHTYVGNIPWYERLFNVPILEEFTKPYTNTSEDSSIFMILMQTAVFGEFSYENVPKIVSVGLYFVNLLTILVSLVSMVVVCVKDKARDGFSRYFMLALWVMVFVSYILFNFQYPYSCTADTRYLQMAVLAGCTYMSMAAQLGNKCGCKWMKRLVIVMNMLAIAYCGFVVVMFG